MLALRRQCARITVAILVGTKISTTMASSSNGTSGYEPIDPNAPPSSLGGKLTIALIVGFILMILCIMFISVYASVFSLLQI